MFDANMRYIPIGQRFFAELTSLSKDDTNDYQGLKKGDVVLCYMITQGHENPIVCMFVPSGHIEVSSNSSGYSLFVYAGRPNGLGFIHDKVKAKALSILDGKWEVKEELK